MSKVAIGQVAVALVALALARPANPALANEKSKANIGKEDLPMIMEEPAGIVRSRLAEFSGIDPAIPVTAYLSEWFKPSLELLEQLVALPPGWDGYGSRPIQTMAHNNMVRILGIAAGSAPKPDLSPIPGGALQMEWSINGRDLEIVTRSDGSITYLTMEGDDGDSIKVEVSSRVDASDVLRRIGWLVGGRSSHAATT